MRREWEEAHTVTEELVEGPPSRRANATLTACPNGNHLWCIGGEFFSDDGKAVSTAVPPLLILSDLADDSIFITIYSDIPLKKFVHLVRLNYPDFYGWHTG
jgi:hypothetical protein